MSFKIIVTGDYACFTRPEMKVERVSYDVPTPSALEGMLKAVYWKPSIRYVIDKIVVFNPINFINIRRNEIKEKVSFQKVRGQMNGNDVSPELFSSELRTQRAGMLLKDVKYGIEFHFEMTGLKSDHEDENEKKYYNIILRRLKNGQVFRQPCLGCREFSVKDFFLTDNFDLSEVSEELKGDIDLGYMLYGMDFSDGGRPLNDDWDNPKFSDEANPIFYRPHLIDGVIDVKKYKEGITC
ncbi:MAG: type I-C CRISPR-associated protein Cas5c [Eubacteriales bacterium]|nr:type I-C CRISPR-associated protein Cas5c [Eubacteriales bacterium]